jgi:hypothetical protein
MSGASEAPLELPLPDAEPSVQLWVGAAANDPSAPIGTVPFRQPQIIFAERKPRLTAMELRARQGRVVPTHPGAARPNLSVVRSSKEQVQPEVRSRASGPLP